MEFFGLGFFGIAVIVVVLYALSSIKILAEYERGVIFRLGRLLSSAKGPGVILVFSPHRPHGARLATPGGARGSAARHHHP